MTESLENNGGSRESSEIIEERAKKTLNSLPPDLQSEISRLKERGAGGKIVEFVDRCLMLEGRSHKLIGLDGLMNEKGGIVGALGVLRDSSEQERAVGCIERYLNGYSSPEEKKAAKQELEDLLG